MPCITPPCPSKATSAHSLQPWGWQKYRWGHGCHCHLLHVNIFVCPLYSELLCHFAFEDFSVDKRSWGMVGTFCAKSYCQLRSPAILPHPFPLSSVLRMRPGQVFTTQTISLQDPSAPILFFACPYPVLSAEPPFKDQPKFQSPGRHFPTTSTR